MDQSQVRVADAYEQLTARFVQWAQEEENVRAAVVIGSRARQDHPADDYSDLDILIFARDPEMYRYDVSWVEQIGRPWLTFLEATPDDRGFERRVLFEGGLDVDFVPDSTAELEALLDGKIPPDVADMIHRGTRILVDKDGFAQRLDNRNVGPPPYRVPSEAQYLNLVNDFWYHTVWTAKKLRRGELWRGKSCCDSYLKNLLREMMEWHTRMTKGNTVDTWMRGRFLEEWADPRAVESLPDIFAHYNPEDIWRALLATMKLFRWLAQETATALGYDYPSQGEGESSAFVLSLYAER